MRIVVTLACVIAAGCLQTRDEELQSDGDSDGGTDEAGEGSGSEVELHDVPCIDQSIAQLMLLEEPAADAIDEVGEDSGQFETRIDATAGGLTPVESFVYARFTEGGLEQVDINDEEAFETADWDIAFRRYLIRLNSGVSGPASVTAARTAPMTEFEALEEVPDDLDYRTEQYFTESCDYVSDGSGLGAPASALASYWSYSSCVEMTGNVYIIALSGDRHVKFEVLAYYTPENQAECNETGMVPMPSGAGNLLVRWAFL